MQDWLNDLRQIAEPDIVVVLVGNKSDLASESTTTTTTNSNPEEGTDVPNGRQVSRQEAEEWASKNGVLEYIETSAKSGEGVELAFGRVAERIYMNIEAGKYDLNDRRSGVKVPGAVGGNRGVKLGSAVGGKGYGCC